LLLLLLKLNGVWFQAVELNSVVADMFKTAYLCCRYKARENSIADRQGRDGDVDLFNIPNVALRNISRNQLTLDQCSGERNLRPPSAVSASSSSDSAAEVVSSIGGGLGSISSITESVNSWSFRFPEIPSLASAADTSDEERSTLLIDDRRLSQNVDTMQNSSHLIKVLLLCTVY